jgi:hypothetical protein
LRFKKNQQTYVGTEKWQPFEGPLSSLKKTIDHMLPIIVVAMASNSPLFNALFIREILFNIEVLNKHLHNKRQMGCQPITKLKFHKCEKKETSFILHATNDLHHSQLTQFDILSETSN